MRHDPSRPPRPAAPAARARSRSRGHRLVRALVAVAAAVFAAWLVLVGFCAAVVPLLAWGFARYDVARDTPA